VKLAGKLLNTCAELGASKTVASGLFKRTITGDAVSAHETGMPLMTFRPIAMHVFASNELPGFEGGLEPAVARRLLVVPFNRTIPTEERVADIGKRVGEEEIDALLYWAVRGAVRLVRNRRYTEPPSSDFALDDWKTQVDPVLAFLSDDSVVRLEQDYDIDDRMVPVRAVFLAFRRRAAERAIRRTPNRMEFAKQVYRSGLGVTAARSAFERGMRGLELVDW